MAKCILAKIARKEVPANIFYEDDYFVAFLDLNPVVEGHALIIPKKDAELITELDEEQQKALGEATTKVAKIIKKKFGSDIGFHNTSGAGASQSIPYFHVHIYPRKEGDRLWEGDKSKVVFDRSSGFERLSPDKENLKELGEELIKIAEGL